MAKEYKMYTLKNGEKRYLFDVNLGYDSSGKRIRTTVRAKSIKEGRKEVARLQLNEKYVISNDSMKFSDVYDLYLMDCKSKDSMTTYENKRSSYRNRYKMFENSKLNKITDRDIYRWKNKVLSKYAIETRRTAESNLNAFFNWCVKNKKINTNPFIYVDREKSDRSKKNKLRFWTEEQFKQFISVVDDEYFKKIFTVLFYTGLRKGELFGLKHKDVDKKNNEIHLNRTAKSINGKITVTNSMKTKTSIRTVPIPRWLDFGTGEENDYIFDPNLYNHIGRKFESYQNKIDNLPKIRIHDLRHSYVAMLINKGIDIYTIKDVVGHAKIAMTLDTYGHLYPDKRKIITNLFD